MNFVGLRTFFRRDGCRQGGTIHEFKQCYKRKKFFCFFNSSEYNTLQKSSDLRLFSVIAP